MTQYLLSVPSNDVEYDTPIEEFQTAYEQVMEFNDEIRAAGVWVFGGGLERASSASVVDATGTGKVTITDGPYIETKEYLGGFWVIEAPDLDVALAWATKASAACMAPVEVRPFQPE